MTDIAPAERLEIEHACARQIIRFARLNDAGEHEALAALFTPSGSYARPTEPDKVVAGRDEILAFFRSRPKRLARHVVGNIVVDAETPTRARAVSTIVLYIAGEGPAPAPIAATLVGEFVDVLEKIDGAWLFAARRGALTLKG